MYLVDTDVIGEIRKGQKANAGVRKFFATASGDDLKLYLSVVTIGELRKDVERIRHRGDSSQASVLARWLTSVCSTYGDFILLFDEDMAHIWGRLCAQHPENPIDKQIAATALIHDLVVVTRNVEHFKPTGVGVLNPFLM